jgi:hypothetical protein
MVIPTKAIYAVFLDRDPEGTLQIAGERYSRSWSDFDDDVASTPLGDRLADRARIEIEDAFRRSESVPRSMSVIMTTESEVIYAGHYPNVEVWDVILDFADRRAAMDKYCWN